MAKKKAEPVLEFVDDEFQTLETSFEQIRTCLGMYLAGEHPDEQPFHEIFNNALDECTNPQSPGNEIICYINENTGEQIVSDNGRGMPHDKMIDACTKNHVSTKFGRRFNKDSAGQNGVGLKVCVATSVYFSMESSRRINKETISKTIEFNDCVLKEHDPITLKKNLHGTTVKFVPSEKYLGPNEMSVDRIHDYLRHMSYCMPRDVRIVLNGVKKGETDITQFAINPATLSDNVNYLSPSLEFEPITIDTLNDDGRLSMAFSYDKTQEGVTVDSYANRVITTEGGEHENICINAICAFLSREAKRLEPNHQFEVTFDDCKKGLVLAVDLHHVDPKFEGQHKAKVGNKNIRETVRPQLMAGLDEYFSSNGTLLRKIISYLRKIAKIRLDANKVKGIDTKSTTNFLEDSDIPKFCPLGSKNKDGYAELLIGEGDSAYNILKKARNPEFQAVFALRGVIPNVIGMSLHQAMSHDVLRNLIKVIGCGVGKDFDVNKCRYNKIIIATDGDIDGDHIASLIVSFFYEFFPEIITHRLLYRVLPPLYIIDKKSAKRLNCKDNERYFYDKMELIRAKNKRIAETTTFTIFPDGEPTELNKAQRNAWLETTRDYLSKLDALRTRIGARKEHLETICKCVLLAGYDPSNPSTYHRFEKEIKKEFPEVEFDDKNRSIYGAHNKDYVVVIVDELFIKAAMPFLKIMIEAETFDVMYEGKDLRPDHGRVSVGRFLEIVNAGLVVDIEQRYKGLGEIDDYMLFISTMNPNVRRLYCFTVNNDEEAKNVIKLLHGKSDKMREERRRMLDEADITLDDLDN